MEQHFLKKIGIQAAKLTSKIFGKKVFVQLIVFFARVGQIDLLTLSYQRIGILNSENDIVSGEYFVVNHYLKEHVIAQTPVYFDVGANQGDYSRMLSEAFPNAKIHAFEPTHTAYNKLKENLSGTSVKLYNLGFGSQKTSRKIYSYSRDTGSPHSSVFSEVFNTLHGAQDVVESEFSCSTIDDFCLEKNIDAIDFLKIDTEGNELDILKGTKRMISENKIHFIQFEFNEMNIISRVFLRDFYDILDQYDFYRLSEKKLISLGRYDSKNEIFRFQNIIAKNKNFLSL